MTRDRAEGGGSHLVPVDIGGVSDTPTRKGYHPMISQAAEPSTPVACAGVAPAYKSLAKILRAALLTAAMFAPYSLFAQTPVPLKTQPVGTLYSDSADWQRGQQVEQGYLVSFSRQEGAVTLTSLAERKDIQVAVTIHGVAPDLITGAALLGPNRLAITGVYNVHSGGAAGFLAYTDLKGQVLTLTDLGVVVPQRVCATEDGTTWILGQDMVKEGILWSHGNDAGKAGPTSDYDMLRAYGPDGKLSQSQLKRSSLAFDSKLFVNLAGGTSALACGNESIGVYITDTERPVWYELRRSNNTSQQWTVKENPDAGRLSGLALPFSATAYASFTFARTDRANSGMLSGMYRLQLGSNSVAQWVAVVTRPENSNAPIPGFKLLGNRGDRLIFVDGRTLTTPVAAVVSSSEVARTSILSSAIALPPKAPSRQVDDPDSGAGVATMVSVARVLLEKIAGAPPQACPAGACSEAVASLQQAVNHWTQAVVQGSRSNAVDVHTKKQIRAALQAINAALADQVGRLNSSQLPQTQSSRSGSLVPISYETCVGSCFRAETTVASDFTTVDAAYYSDIDSQLPPPDIFNPQAPYGGTFLNVACTDNCNAMMTHMLAICAIGGGVAVARGSIGGALLALACVAASAYVTYDCFQDCDKLKGCTSNNFSFPDRKVFVVNQPPRPDSGALARRTAMFRAMQTKRILQEFALSGT